MQKLHSTVTHREGMAFEVEANGHTFTIDGAPEHGGHDLGPRPKTLVLAGLAGCTAMDVVSILGKMRQPVEHLSVRAEGERTSDGFPSTLVDIVVTYEVSGAVDPGKLWRAVTLSEETYCGVSAMLKKHTTVSSRVILNGEELPRPE